jgi:hypothetical protein
MKKSLLLILFIAGFANAQETEFKFTKDGFTDFVVINIEGKNQQELYKKALDWLQVTYKNPKEVIKAQIENDYVRIEGIRSSMFCMKSLGMLNCLDGKYQIEISFKDGKYKFDVISVEHKSTYGWSAFLINGDIGQAYFKENGEIRSAFKLYPDAFQSTFNDLNKDLESFLKSETIPSKTEEW